jgi:mxaJ protein
MYFRCLSSLLVAAGLLFAGDTLRVCADPNNLPFSNEQRQGFENKIAEHIAATLNMPLEYVWWPERKSLVKQTLDSGRCEVLLGVPSTLDTVTTTQPYYTSTYVFVTRRDTGLHVTSLADPRLSKVRIGIHIVGDDFAPPAAALAYRGITSNIVGYSLFGTKGEANPPSKLIDAVGRGEVDVAIVWGPLAGFFARSAAIPLEVVPVSPPMFMGIPFTFATSLAVRKGDDALAQKLDSALNAQALEVKRILSEYAVPEAP